MKQPLPPDLPFPWLGLKDRRILHANGVTTDEQLIQLSHEVLCFPRFGEQGYFQITRYLTEKYPERMVHEPYPPGPQPDKGYPWWRFKDTPENREWWMSEMRRHHALGVMHYLLVSHEGRLSSERAQDVAGHVHIVASMQSDGVMEVGKLKCQWKPT